jgi:ribose/xylose/arabinose/galactoside ABC-type transport system permease subunit
MSRRLLRDYGSLLGLLLIGAALSLLSDRFLTTSNLINVARQVSINAIVAAGMTIVIITGGIDLSVGSTIALAGCAALLVARPVGDVVGMTAGILLAAGVGFLNGALVAWGRVPPFITTLATMTVVRGAALVLTNGEPIVKTEGAYLWLGQASVGPIPVPILLMVATLIGAHWFLSRTRWGTYIYAVGGNAEAARLSGISLAGIQILVYVLGGALAGLAGLVLAARLSSAQPNTGVGFELDAIAAVVLGGTSLMGGEGTIWGTTVGAFIIGILNNGFNLMNVSPFYQLIAKGAVIVLAVLVDQIVKAGAASGAARGGPARAPAEQAAESSLPR